MKKLLILILLLVMPFVIAEDVILYEYDSYEDDGINITLMNINEEEDKFVICVNAEKYIVTETGISEKKFIIKDIDIDKDKVYMDILIDCDYCGECTGYCNNKRCFSNPKYIPHVKEEEEQIEEDIIEDKVNVGIYALFVFIILFVVILLIAYYVIKKKI